MIELEVKGFIETSFLDWDGKVVSVIYVPHCNFRCPFCHNSGLIKDPQSYDSIPFERIEKYLLDRRDFIDGVCITGGEPCLHKDKGLFEFMRRIKDLGFQIKFDTNGTSPELLDKLFNDKLLDYVAMDIKGPLDERYNKLSGIKTNLEVIKKSIKIIMDKEIPYEFRTTVVPTLLDTKDIKDIARSVAGAGKFVLQQFTADHTWDEALRSVKPYPREKLEGMVEVSKPFIPNTVIRGA